MIVRINFVGHEPMLFGDSYKPWYTQANEFFRLHPEIYEMLDTLEYSNASWIKWGGLKWCPDTKVQAHLNREGVQEGEPNNPNPRKYDDMPFRFKVALFEKLNRPNE